MSMTQALRQQPPQPPQPGAGGAPQPGAGAGPEANQAQQAAQACGALVQTIKSFPGIDQHALEAAAANLRQALMQVVQVAHPQQQQGGGAPPGGGAPM